MALVQLLKYVVVLVQLNSFSYYFVLDGEERNEQGKCFVPSDEDATSSHSQLYGQEESGMNALFDSITDALMIIYQ
jgi:hypothetical protein